MVLLSGSGRNVGKTTLACNVIRHLSEYRTVYGLKLSPHFHKMNHLQKLIAHGEGYKVYRELDPDSGKDSAKMLAAGAREVYFIQCEDANIETALRAYRTRFQAMRLSCANPAQWPKCIKQVCICSWKVMRLTAIKSRIKLTLSVRIIS